MTARGPFLGSDHDLCDMKELQLLVAVLTLTAVPCAAAVRAGDWPHWRGPERNDHIADDSGWDARAWPPKDALWSANVGEGASSPPVIWGRLYCLGWNDGQDGGADR